MDPPNIQPLKSHRGVFIQPSSAPQLTNLKSYEENLVRLELAEQEKEAELTSVSSMTPVTSDLMEACPSPLRLAQQLTHVELERFSMIGPEEFVQAFHKEISDDVSEGFCSFFLPRNFHANKEMFLHVHCLVWEKNMTCTMGS